METARAKGRTRTEPSSVHLRDLRHPTSSEPQPSLETIERCAERVSELIRRQTEELDDFDLYLSTEIGLAFVEAARQFAAAQAILASSSSLERALKHLDNSIDRAVERFSEKIE